MGDVRYDTRDQLISGLVSAVGGIQVAAGYNTDPLLVDSAQLPERKDEPTVWVVVGDERVADLHTGRAHSMELEVEVCGSARLDPQDSPATALRPINALLNDVRSAITGFMLTIDETTKDSSGNARAVGVELGDCVTDEGVLREQGHAFFSQSLSFSYLAEAGW